jgi:chromosome segregation ATPase
MEELRKRWEAATKKRDDLVGKIQRLQGKREASLKELEDVNDKIRAKGIDPEKIDEVLEVMTTTLRKDLEAYEESLALVAKDLEKYKGLL